MAWGLGEAPRGALKAVGLLPQDSMMNWPLIGALRDYVSTPNVKIEIYDPIATCLYLAIYQYMPEGTKLVIQNNHFRFTPAGFFQPVIRWIQKSNHEELGLLGTPIQSFIHLANSRHIMEEDYALISSMMIQSLEKLKLVYAHVKVVVHTLDRYIDLLKSRNLVNFQAGDVYLQYFAAWNANSLLKVHILFLRMIQSDQHHIEQFIQMMQYNEGAIQMQISI